MSIADTSISYNLSKDENGVLSVKNQETGMIGGLIAEVTGTLNGGMSGSVGLSHTVFNVALPVIGGAVDHWRKTGAWGVPFTRS